MNPPDLKLPSFTLAEEKMDSTLKRAIYEGFKEHALASVSYDGDLDEITFTIRNTKDLLGCIVSMRFWGSLHIKYLYVTPSWRRKGLGRLLMKKTLAKAREKNLRFAFVETMSFQALDFYKKFGFKEEFSRKGYERDTILHYLKLDFT